MRKLSVEALKRAIFSLEKSMAVTAPLLKDPHSSEALKETLQAGVIQNFEFCYELSFKMLKRQLEKESTTPALFNTMSYQEIIREGAIKGLIANPKKWFKYREKRNLTSHNYDTMIAKEVYLAAVEFYDDVSDLLARLQEKIND